MVIICLVWTPEKLFQLKLFGVFWVSGLCCSDNRSSWKTCGVLESGVMCRNMSVITVIWRILNSDWFEKFDLKKWLSFAGIIDLLPSSEFFWCSRLANKIWQSQVREVTVRVEEMETNLKLEKFKQRNASVSFLCTSLKRCWRHYWETNSPDFK